MLCSHPKTLLNDSIGSISVLKSSPKTAKRLQSCQIVRTDQDWSAQSGPVFLVHSHTTIYGDSSPIFSEFLEQYFIDVDIYGLKNSF